MKPAPPVRRLAALGVDYLLIAGYLILPAATSLVILRTSLRERYLALWSNAQSTEAAGFLLLTPVSGTHPRLCVWPGLDEGSGSARLPSLGRPLVNVAYHYLDLVPKGRNEAEEGLFWVRRHDEYQRLP